MGRVTATAIAARRERNALIREFNERTNLLAAKILHFENALRRPDTPCQARDTFLLSKKKLVFCISEQWLSAYPKPVENGHTGLKSQLQTG
jgi:hypothetical protein